VWYRFAKIIIAGKKKHIIEDIAEYFSKQGHDFSQLEDRLNELDKANKLPIIELRKDSVMFNGIIYTNFLKFAEAVDALYTELIFSKRIKEQKELTKEEIDFAPGEIQVFACNDVNDAIRYGVGTSWCISQPGNTQFQSYRDSSQSTFYYVNDGTRPPEDPLSRVMVDMQADGKVELTDKNNQTGTIAEFDEDHEAYFDYLRKNGVDTSQFVNKPVTEEERKENELLGKRNVTPNWFEKLPPEYKSKYIGRGYLLSDQQLESIINLSNKNISEFLIKQYLNAGISIPPSQKAMLFGNNQYSATYNRRRARAIEEIKKQFGNDDWELQKYALKSGDYELIDEIINEKGINIFWDVKASEEILRYLFSKGLSEDHVDWDWITRKQELSEDFIREFQDNVDWEEISANQKLSEDFIREFKNRVYWYHISWKQTLSEEFIREFADRVDWNSISRYQTLSENFIKEFADRVNWWWISTFQTLSEDFIGKFERYVDWKVISSYQKLTEDFIRKYQDKVTWELISQHQTLSEDFIRDFAGLVNWKWISRRQTLSADFIREFAESVDWLQISYHQTLSEDFIRKFANRVHWNGISENTNISNQTKHSLKAAGYPIIIY
jgi:hypothetical protein